MQALLIFPHQLFETNAQLALSVERVYLVEDALYFSQYRFHKQKLVLHRASMRAHADYLRSHSASIEYVDFGRFRTLLDLFKHMANNQMETIHHIDVVDDWLQRRVTAACKACGMGLVQHRSPMFLSDDGLLKAHFSGHEAPRMARFYVDQRRRSDILMMDGSPVGGRWSFDEDNRKRLPRSHWVPPLPHIPANSYVDEAQEYVETHFAENPGNIEPFGYPVMYQDAQAWLDEFLVKRLPEFGNYEDAMSTQHDVLFHSVLSPSLNIGLLTPRQIIDAALSCQDRVPINSLEGFIRQVAGWREYMRGAYVSVGARQRTHNRWNHSRRLPASFWTATTSIAPIDAVISKIIRSGYAHHIERLMLLANFMQLCEFEPDQVYQWFMEMFIDAYDWVMVPNVYGMALYADGGSTTTKPYISGSNYVLKMSDFSKGPWCAIWDGLYWRFIAKHREEFAANPRTQFYAKGLDRMDPVKRSMHLQTAENFLRTLDG
jgi:deoxyribodipyrimidine photolyase-related protein